MSAYEDHATTAVDQLALAYERAETVEQQHAGFLAAAQVHALLAVGEAVRQAGMDAAVRSAEPFSSGDFVAWRDA